MSARGALALVLTDDVASAHAAELLRVVAALVAADQPVRLACAGAGRGAFAGDAVDAEVEVYLDGIADFGVVPTVLEGAAWIDALAGVRDLLRLAPPDRAHEPALLVVDDAWLDAARTDPDTALTTLTAAGQVLRA